MTFDEMLKQAFDETAEERAAQMLTVEKKHRFSLAYRLWEHKILRDLRRNHYDRHWTLRKAKRVVAGIIAASSLLLGVTVYAAIAVIGRYSFDTKPDYSKLLIENHPSDKTAIEEYYGLPEKDGWELVSYDILVYSTMLNYKCGDKMVSFRQNIIMEGSMGNINTENTVVEPMFIYEENDGFIIIHQSGTCSLYWIYDGYLFTLGGNITKNEAVDLAHSTKIVDLVKNY